MSKGPCMDFVLAFEKRGETPQTYRRWLDLCRDRLCKARQAAGSNNEEMARRLVAEVGRGGFSTEGLHRLNVLAYAALCLWHEPLRSEFVVAESSRRAASGSYDQHWLANIAFQRLAMGTPTQQSEDTLQKTTKAMMDAAAALRARTMAERAYPRFQEAVFPDILRAIAQNRGWRHAAKEWPALLDAVGCLRDDIATKGRLRPELAQAIAKLNPRELCAFVGQTVIATSRQHGWGRWMPLPSFVAVIDPPCAEGDLPPQREDRRSGTYFLNVRHVGFNGDISFVGLVDSPMRLAAVAAHEATHIMQFAGGLLTHPLARNVFFAELMTVRAYRRAVAFLTGAWGSDRYDDARRTYSCRGRTTYELAANYVYFNRPSEYFAHRFSQALDFCLAKAWGFSPPARERHRDVKGLIDVAHQAGLLRARL
jgi:hypothetical protein